MRRALILSVLAASTGLAGCVGDPAEEALPQGLTVLDAEVGSLSLAYRSQDVVIYMQAERGQATPDVYQANPTMPRFEVDALFTDESGYAFYTRMGGDGWVDTSWQQRLEAQGEILPPVASNAVLYGLAGEAAAVMRDAIANQVGAELAAELEPEISAIHGFASRAPAFYAEQLDVLNAERAEQGMGPMELPPELVDQTGEVVYGTNGPEQTSFYSSTDAYYYLSLHHAYIDYTNGEGYHSATALHRWSGSSWLRVHDAANHGSAASEMGRKCNFQYYDTYVTNDWFTYIYQGHCAGTYAWDSDGDNGRHNCHDDSRIQMYNFVYGSSLGYSGTYSRWCNGGDDDTDISVDIWGVELDQEGSPDCSSSCRRGYGWCP